MKLAAVDGKGLLVSEKNRTGRPLKEHAAGTQVTITLQVPAELKSRLQAKALSSNRSLSQEAERRLERSFSVLSLQEDAVTLAVEEANARFSEQLAKTLSDLQADAEARLRLIQEEVGRQEAEERASIKELVRRRKGP
jgi:hypothetical protein